MPSLTDLVPAAAIAAAIGFLVIAVFQAALALGAPLGRAAWGGASDVLPSRLRISSVVAFVIWLVAPAIVLGRAGIEVVGLPHDLLVWGSWALVVLSALGAIVNFASSSPWERFGWGPLAALLAILSLVVASSPGA
jgi:hypothetical protein